MRATSGKRLLTISRQAGNFPLMAVQTPQFRMANQVVGGRLNEILAGYQAAGHPPEHISRLLFAEHELAVSRQTLVRWLDALDSPADADSPDDDEPVAATG